MRLWLLGSLFAVASVASADVLVGAPGDASGGNCFPFGCFFLGNPSANYQQVYSSTAFSGPITIFGVSFFLSDPAISSGNLNSGTYTVSLSTTSMAVNGLDSNFSNNVGPDDTVIFTGSLPPSVLPGTPLQLGGAGVFTYNPALGNLLLSISITGIGAPVAGVSLFEARNGTSGGIFSRVHDFGGVFFDNTGLVTEFDTTEIPEPSGLLMAASGLVAMLGLARRGRKARDEPSLRR